MPTKPLDETVEMLRKSRQNAKKVRGKLFQIKVSEKKEAKTRAEEAILLGQEFDKNIGTALDNLERVDSDVEIPLKSVGQMGIIQEGYDRTKADKQEIDMRLYDVKELFRRDVLNVCDDVRQGLAHQADVEDIKFFDGEKNPRKGYQILCKIYAGLKAKG